MATNSNSFTETFYAGEDLRARQFHFVRLSAAADATKGKVIRAGAGQAIVGVLLNKPNVDEEAQVQVLGRAKFIAGGSIAVNGLVAVDTAGQGKAAVLGTTNTSDAGAAADPLVGSYAVGINVGGDVVQNQIGEVLLQHFGAVPTTAA